MLMKREENFDTFISETFKACSLYEQREEAMQYHSVPLFLILTATANSTSLSDI